MANDETPPGSGCTMTGLLSLMFALAGAYLLGSVGVHIGAQHGTVSAVLGGILGVVLGCVVGPLLTIAIMLPFVPFIWFADYLSSRNKKPSS